MSTAWNIDMYKEVLKYDYQVRKCTTTMILNSIFKIALNHPRNPVLLIDEADHSPGR